MSLGDKIGSKAEEVIGKLKTAVGDLTDNEQLEAEGRAQTTAAKAKQAGEAVKEAAEEVADTVADKVSDVAESIKEATQDTGDESASHPLDHTNRCADHDRLAHLFISFAIRPCTGRVVTRSAGVCELS